MLIRRVVGYERLVGLEAAQLLAELYAALRLFNDLIQPSFKLKSGVRVGAGSNGCTTRRQHRCSSSCAPELSDYESQPHELRKRCVPVGLLATMRGRCCQSRLGLLINGQRACAMAGDSLGWQTLE